MKNNKIIYVSTSLSFFRSFYISLIRSSALFYGNLYLVTNFNQNILEIEDLHNVNQVDIGFSRYPFSIKNLTATFKLSKYLNDFSISDTLIHTQTPISSALVRFVNFVSEFG